MLDPRRLMLLALLVMAALLLTAFLLMAGEVGLHVENDTWNGTDRAYTHGTRFSASPSPSHTWIGGQLMYTPSDITVSELQEDDRPYAGWLYVGKIWRKRDHAGRIHRYELTVGTLGPHAMADDAQTWAHESTGNRTPMGWDHQIGNQPTVQGLYKLITEAPRAEFLGLEVAPMYYGELALGNVWTYASVGTGLRYGYNLGKNYSEPVVHPTTLDTGISIYTFAEVEGRYVLHNVFLDGAQDSHWVEKYPPVADVRAGIGISGKYAAVTLAQVYRTKEFKGQHGPARYNSLSLTFKW